MALSKSTITGRVPLPTDENMQFAELTFALSGLDTEGASVLPGGVSTRAVLVGSDIPAGFELWQNTAGLRGTHYRVLARWTVKDRDGVRDQYADIGIIQIGSDPSYPLADLLNSSVPQAVGTFWSAITEAEYDAVIDAAASAAAAAESMTAVMDFVTVAAEPIWASSRMKFVTDAGQWWAKRVNLMVVGGQSNRVRYSITPGAGESQGNVFVWNGSAWLVATPALIGDITYVEAHRVSLVEGRPVFVVHGAVAGTAIARWVPGGDLFDALKASAIAAMADLASRGYQISRKVYDFSQGEGEYDLAPLHSLSTFRYPAFINGVRGADYLGSGCQIIITELLRQSMGGTTDRVNREWQRLISAGYTGVHLAPSDGLATEDPTDGSVQVVHFNPAGRIEMGLRCADIQLGLSNGVTSGDVAGRITATTERIWKERAYTWLGVINIGAGNVNNQVLNLLTAITGTPILWEVGGVTTEIASGVTASTYTYVGASDTQIVIWGPTDANYDQAMGFSAVATPGQGGIRSFVLNPLAHLASLYISGHSGLMHNVNPSTWGKRMEAFRLDAAPLVTFDSFVAADMPKSLTLLSFTSTTPVPQWAVDAISAENTKRSGAISVTVGGTPAGFRKGNHFSVFSQLTTAIANGYRESNGQIISIGDAGAQTLYWLIADSVAAGVGGIAPAGWKVATTGDAARIAALEALGGNGLIIKEPVALATTANITLSGEQVLDGFMTSASRVLVKDQTLPEQNGPYITGPGAWTRATDMDAAGEVLGTAVYVSGGTINAGRRYYTGSTVTTIGTDPIVWVMESDSAFILAQIAAITAVANNALQSANEAAFKANLWRFKGDGTAALPPVLVSEAGLVMVVGIDPANSPFLTADEAAFKANMWRFKGDGSLSFVPVLVSEAGLVIGTASVAELVQAAAVIGIITNDGQSNGEGQANTQRSLVYNYIQSNILTLLRGSAADQWLGMATGGGASSALVGSTITAIGPMLPQIPVSDTYGTTAGEACARNMAARHGAPILTWSNAEGGQQIANLLPSAGPGSSTGFYAFENIITALTQAQALKPLNTRLVYQWLCMSQGEGDTGNALLGQYHNDYRAAVQTQAQTILGQAEPVRMLSAQMSSFGSGTDGVESILAFAKANAADGLFFCSGPSYPFEYSPDDPYLHHISVAHAQRGERDAAIIRQIEETGVWHPLVALSATRTGANQITVIMSKPVEQSTTAVVAAIANLGITLDASVAISSVTVSGSTAVINTVGLASGASEVRFGLVGQTTPRTLARIPRTNLRAQAPLGAYSVAGWGLIYDWCAHHRIAIS